MRNVGGLRTSTNGNFRAGPGTKHIIWSKAFPWFIGLFGTPFSCQSDVGQVPAIVVGVGGTKVAKTFPFTTHSARVNTPHHSGAYNMPLFWFIWLFVDYCPAFRRALQLPKRPQACAFIFIGRGRLGGARSSKLLDIYSPSVPPWFKTERKI